MSERRIGKPKKWSNPEELREKIEEYFNWAEERCMKISVTGLAWYLGCSKQTLQNYEKCYENNWLKNCDDETKKEYVDLLKDTKRYIEMHYEERTYDKKTVTGAIFALKNLFGWVDKQEIVNTDKKSIGDMTEEELNRRLEELKG